MERNETKKERKIVEGGDKKKREKFDRTGKGSRIPKKGETIFIFQKTLRTKISLATRNALQKLTLFYTFRRRRRRRKETRRRRHERVGRESVKARRTVEDPRGTTTTTTTTTTRELHRETGDVGVFLFLVGAWSFFIGENRSAAERRKGVVLVVVVVVVVQPSSISSSVEHTQSLTQNNTDPMSFTQTGVETPGRRGHRLRAENADNSREKRWIERHHRGRSRGNGFTRVFERDERGRERYRRRRRRISFRRFESKSERM